MSKNDKIKLMKAGEIMKDNEIKIYDMVKGLTGKYEVPFNEVCELRDKIKNLVRDSMLDLLDF